MYPEFAYICPVKIRNIFLNILFAAMTFIALEGVAENYTASVPGKGLPAHSVTGSSQSRAAIQTVEFSIRELVESINIGDTSYNALPSSNTFISEFEAAQNFSNSTFLQPTDLRKELSRFVHPFHFYW